MTIPVDSVREALERLQSDVDGFKAKNPNSRLLVEPEDRTITVNMNHLETVLSALRTPLTYADTPEGMVLVPVEPTEAMLAACVSTTDSHARAVWSAATAAAPSLSASSLREEG